MTRHDSLGNEFHQTCKRLVLENIFKVYHFRWPLIPLGVRKRTPNRPVMNQDFLLLDILLVFLNLFLLINFLVRIWTLLGWGSSSDWGLVVIIAFIGTDTLRTVTLFILVASILIIWWWRRIRLVAILLGRGVKANQYWGVIGIVVFVIGFGLCTIGVPVEPLVGSSIIITTSTRGLGRCWVRIISSGVC